MIGSLLAWNEYPTNSWVLYHTRMQADGNRHFGSRTQESRKLLDSAFYTSAFRAGCIVPTRNPGFGAPMRACVAGLLMGCSADFIQQQQPRYKESTQERVPWS